MVYVRSASAQKLVDNAHTKLVVYFLDGNARTWYGRNNIREGRVAVDPRAVEIKRHERWVRDNAAAIKVACLYDLADGHEIARFKKGEWQ